MAQAVASPKTAAPSRSDTGEPVWKRIWQHAHTDAKDDALLQRERRSPRWALIVETLTSTFGGVKGLRTIELGSGRGDLSALLAQDGAKVTLVDRCDLALEEACHRFDRLGLMAQCERGDLLANEPSRRGGFDVAISSGVEEHFRGGDRAGAIRAHFDVLRPGGLAIVSVPNAWCLPYRLWKCYLEFRGWWPYGMELPYSKRELRTCADAAGFARTRVCAMGFWQSVGDHWGKSLLGRGPDWIERTSRLDTLMGSTLVLFAWRGGHRVRAGERLHLPGQDPCAESPR